MIKIKFPVFFCIMFFTALLSCDMNFDTLKILSFSPGNKETGVLPERVVEVSFSAPVNRTDVEDGFSLKNREGSVEGNFTWLSPGAFRYTPVSPMTKNGRYVMELPRRIRDDDGNIMDSDFISEFYVGNDFTPPVVLSSDPPRSDGAVQGVAVNHAIIINFSKSMNRGSVEREFTLSPDVPGYFAWTENTPGVPDSRLTCNLTAAMEYGRLYTLTVSKSAEDSAGNSLGSDYRVNFITGDDRTPPEVVSIYEYREPANPWSVTDINHVSRRDIPCLTFSEAMERQSVEKAFSVTPSVQGVFEWSSDTTVIFRPSKILAPETRYQITVETSAKDLGGHRLRLRFSAEIVTDRSDSLYVRCGNVRGANHDGDFVSLPESWPRIIDMGSGTPVNRNYFLLLDFTSDDAGATPVVMNRYSIFDNIFIDTFKGISVGEPADVAHIRSIEWRGDSTAMVEITGMTNRSADQVPALYRLRISGGENGIRERNSNYMKEDFVMELREAMP